MTKDNTYEVSDSLWGRVVQYASALKESWSKDVDEYINERKDTNERSQDEYSASTLLQHLGHDAGLVTHLVGSVFSNDYTKERVKELEEAISSTESYQSTKETMNKLEHTLEEASQQFMKEHPQVQTAFMATKERLEEIKEEVSKEAEAFVKNHPEITNDVKALVEIGMVLPAAKVGKIALETKELNALNKLEYTHDQGKALAKGIPSEIDKKTLNLEELAVTAEGQIENVNFFDVNQRARVTPHPETETLNHDVIRKKEAKNIAKVEREIERKEKEGNPLSEEEKEEKFYKASKPNATLAQSHAETALIQKAYEQGLTQDAHMFIKVNGKEVCGHCNSDTIAMAEKAGLKSITIHDYNVKPNKDDKILPVLHWNQDTGRKRYASFEALEKDLPHAPEVPEHIKYAGIIETEKTQMNSMDYAILGANGALLMQGNESTGDIQAQTPATPKARTILTANNTTRADDIIRADSNSQPQSCSLLLPEMRYDNAQIAEFDTNESMDENNLTQTQENEKGAYLMGNDILLSSGLNTTATKDIKLSPEGYAIYEESEEIDDTKNNEDDYGMEM